MNNNPTHDPGPADTQPSSVNPDQTSPAASEKAEAPTQVFKFALWALVCGIVAFLLGTIPVLGFLVGAGAVVLGIFAILRAQKKGFAITGIVLGALAAISSLTLTATLLFVSPEQLAAAERATQALAAETEALEKEQLEEQKEKAAEKAAKKAEEDAEKAAKKAEEDAAKAAKKAEEDAANQARRAAEEAARIAAEQAAAAEAARTIGQKNAIRSAQSYLNYTAFSRSGLIGQLQYEGYTVEDATYGVDTVNADWNEQAALTAQNYLSYTAFSSQGLYDQLVFEGFTPEQAAHGISAVGY